MEIEKESFRKKASAQDGFLDQIKTETKSAFLANKDLEKKVNEAESECVKLQKEIDLLLRKNRDVDN